MPITVPTLDASSVEPEVPQGGELNVQVSPDDAGAGAGAGLNQAGRAMQDMQQRYDEVQTQTATTQYGEASMQHLEQVLASKGTNAAPAAIAAADALRQKRGEIANSLANNNQKDQFTKAADASELEFLHWSGRHVAQEADQVDTSSTVAALHLATQQGALGSMDPVNVAMKYHALNDTIDRAAVRQGWDPDTTTSNRLQATNGYWAAVMDSQLTQKAPQAAAAILSTYGDEMTQETRDRYTKATQVGTTDVQAQATADKMLAPDPNTGEVTPFKTLLPQINAIQDLDLRESTLQRVKQGIADNNEADAQAKTQVVAKAQAQMAARGYSYDAIDPQVKSQLTPEVVKSLMSDQDWFKDQKDQPTNELTWLEFHDAALRHLGDGSAQDLSKMNPDVFYGTYRGDVSKETFDKMSSVYNEIRTQVDDGKGPGTGPQVQSMLSLDKRIDDSLVGTPLMPANVQNGDKYESPGLTPDQQKFQAQFRMNLDAQMTAKARTMKVKELAPEDQQAIIDDNIRKTVFVKGTNPHWYSGSDIQVPAASMSNDDQAARAYTNPNTLPTLEQIPPDQIQRFKGVALGVYGKATLSNDQIRRIAAAAAVGADGIVDKIMKE